MTVEDSRNCVSLWLFANKVKHATNKWTLITIVYGCVVAQQCVRVCLWQGENERKVTDREKDELEDGEKSVVTKLRRASWECWGQKS